jgi:hypothetical protein
MENSVFQNALLNFIKNNKHVKLVVMFALIVAFNQEIVHHVK